MKKTKTGLPLFPWEVLKSRIYESAVISAADAFGVREVIYQGDTKTAQFIAAAANRMSKTAKGTSK